MRPGLYLSEGTVERNVTSRKCEIKEMTMYVANETKHIKIKLHCIKHETYFNGE
jgi:hypothetical protein